MKKPASIVLIFILLLTLTACQTSTSLPAATSGKSTTAETSPATTASPAPTPTSSPAPTPVPAPESAKYSLVAVYPNLTFNQPLYFTTAGDGSQNAFVVERTGQIKIFADIQKQPEPSSISKTRL